MAGGKGPNIGPKTILAGLQGQQLHLNKGLAKLSETESDVNTMKEDLSRQNLILDQKNKEADIKMEQMLKDKEEAAAAKTQAETLSVQVGKQQEEIETRQAAVTKELASVEPAIKEAKEAVGGIKKSHLDEVRALGKPPAAVRLTLEATFIMLGRGKMAWKDIQKALREKGFIPSIIAFDPDLVTDKARKVMEKDYIPSPDFQLEKVAKASRAASPLCKWCRAQLLYSSVLARAQPLRDEVAKLVADGQEAKDKFDGLMATVAAMELKVDTLKKEYSVLIADKSKIEETLKVCKIKVDRSNGLLNNLGSERDRWQSQQEGFQSQLATVPGDALIAAGFLAYIGYFNEARPALPRSWANFQAPSQTRMSPSAW